MINPQEAREEYNLAIYLLKHRFNNPMDLLRYWGFCGPCLEDYPEIEKIAKSA